MKDQLTQSGFIKLRWLVGGFVALTGFAVAMLTLWPTKSSALQQANFKRLDYSQSVASINQQLQQETSKPGLRPECRSIFKTHNRKTAKAVLLIHGVSSCPYYAKGLAEYFYQQGYNVYAPRVPKHGYTDNKRHGEISIKDMGNYVNTSAEQISGLGDEVGVVGHSGGGTMATWLLEYGGGLFSRGLLLAPFYEPSAKMLPKWQVPYFRTAYGYNLVPDKFTADSGLSYRALAKYVLMKESYRKDLQAPGVKRIAVVTSESDDAIDADLARGIPQAIAKTSRASFDHHRLPKSLNINHNLGLDKPNEKMSQNLYQHYFDLYAGRPTDSW